MDRLSALDTEFLTLEDGVTRLHIAGICTFADPPPKIDELTELISSKLHLVPRYRQRVRTVPFDLGRPVWSDDPHFNLAYHVRHTALPAPGGDEDLCNLMGRLMSQPLDRDRPLWETWLVEGLDDDRWALILKVHHSMVDGIAGVGLLTVLLDLEADAALPEPEPWEPEPEPSSVKLLADSWGDSVLQVGGLLGQAPSVLHDPLGAARGMGRLGGGLATWVGHLVFTPHSSIEGGIGPHRVWCHAEASLDTVKHIGHSLGGTVNDVVLAAVTGGYRALLEERGDDPARCVVRSLVPVSVRGADGGDALANKVSGMLLELPVDIGDPRERLESIRGSMQRLKGSHMAEAGEVVAEIGNLAPPSLVASISRLGLASPRVVLQRSVTTVTTNVPGPQFPLYCLGHEMLQYLPYVPIIHGVRIGTAILSYNGHLAFGITGDFDSTTDLPVLAAGIQAGIEELAALC
jgi:WS/DGAT/MGAT family acyltransferase